MSMLAMFDVANAVSYLAGLPVGAYTATANGSAVDLSTLSEPVIAAILHSAAGTGTSPTLDISFEHSEDGSTGWSAIPAAALTDANGDASTFTQVTNSGASQQVKALRKQLLKRYIRVVRTITGTTPSFTAAVILAGVKRSVN